LTFVHNDKLLFPKITILSELSESNTSRIEHFKVLHFSKRISLTFKIVAFVYFTRSNNMQKLQYIWTNFKGKTKKKEIAIGNKYQYLLVFPIKTQYSTYFITPWRSAQHVTSRCVVSIITICTQQINTHRNCKLRVFRFSPLFMV